MEVFRLTRLRLVDFSGNFVSIRAIHFWVPCPSLEFNGVVSLHLIKRDALVNLKVRDKSGVFKLHLAYLIEVYELIFHTDPCAFSIYKSLHL